MIIVYHFSSGSSYSSCDGANLWGHSAVTFGGLGKESFGISQMKMLGTNPTYRAEKKSTLNADKPGSSDSRRDKGKQKEQSEEEEERQSLMSKPDKPINQRGWRYKFFANRPNHAFPKVMAIATIISDEDLQKREGWGTEGSGFSEMKVLKWWQLVEAKETEDWLKMSRADCADTVYAALKKAMYGEALKVSTPLIVTPQTVLWYGQRLSAHVAKQLKLEEKFVKEVVKGEKLLSKLTQVEEDLDVQVYAGPPGAIGRE